jgi:hypothetical protein
MFRNKKKATPPCTICHAEMDEKHLKRGFNICIWCDKRHGPFRGKRAAA